MKRRLLLALLACALPATPQAGGASTDASAGSAGEHWSGFADVRNRFVTDVGGDSQVYRSIVNLGEGPRLYEGEMRFVRPGGRWLDELSLSGDALGGDPSSGALLQAHRAEQYDLRLHYRNFAYFNNLPSFANPLLNEGLLLSQRALDDPPDGRPGQSAARPHLRALLRLLPRRRFRARRNAYVADGNEFPVSTNSMTPSRLFAAA